MAHVGRERRLAAKIAGIMGKTATPVAAKAPAPSKPRATAVKAPRKTTPRPAAKKTT